MEKQQEQRTINLTEIQVKDLDGNVIPVPDLHKRIGNRICMSADTIEVSDIGRILHKGESASVSDEELIEIVLIIKSHPYYKPFIQTQILTYLNK